MKELSLFMWFINLKTVVILKLIMLVNEIDRVLGKPYYQTHSCLIYQLDCLDAMIKIPDDLINLTVTSPPYNIGKDYEKNCQLMNIYLGAICGYQRFIELL